MLPYMTECKNRQKQKICAVKFYKIHKKYQFWSALFQTPAQTFYCTFSKISESTFLKYTSGRLLLNRWALELEDLTYFIFGNILTRKRILFYFDLIVSWTNFGTWIMKDTKDVWKRNWWKVFHCHFFIFTVFSWLVTIIVNQFWVSLFR